MGETTNRQPRLNQQSKLILAGCSALGIGFGLIYGMFWAGLFIGLGVGLIAAARMLKRQEI